MSYILDALKKLEDEKNRKNRGSGGMLNISGELFKEERSYPSRGAYWKIAAVVVVASLVTFGATWLYLKADKADDGAKQYSTTPTLPARPVMPGGPSQLPVSTSIPQVPQVAAPDNAPVRQVVMPVMPVVKAPVPLVEEGEQQRERRQILKKKMTIAVPTQSVVPNSPPPSDIKVSGIAWQDAHSARRAVVNGFLMQEGSIVLGAKITEIYQDRVRFTKDGRVFEVNLLASGLTETAK